MRVYRTIQGLQSITFNDCIVYRLIIIYYSSIASQHSTLEGPFSHCSSCPIRSVPFLHPRSFLCIQERPCSTVTMLKAPLDSLTRGFGL